MPKKIDPKVRERCIRQVLEHLPEYRVHPHRDLPQRPYRTIGDVEYATAGWVDWYNNRRLHRTLE